MNARPLLPLLLLLLAAPAPAQEPGPSGFAGLGAAAEGFAIPERGHDLRFPEDHGPHPLFRIEWWYLTANLEGPDGTPHGVQWTLFRTALRPTGLPEDQVWMGHAAVTRPGAHRAAERLALGGTGQAGVVAEPFAAWIDEWRLEGDLDGPGGATVTAQGPDWAYDLRLLATGPVVLQGDRGYSVKSPEGQASHYYSLPFLAAEGTLLLPEGEVAVTGTAWIDREWSSQPLSPDQTGWDWFSLSFETGEKMMGFRLNARDGSRFTAATWIAPDGTPTPFPDGAFDAEPLGWTEVAGRRVPTRWRVTLPERGLDATVAAVEPAAWMPLSVPYWEGPVTVEGSHRGRGYLEMTGY
ncbi:lipocalin-like domain-containing protein [Rubellimicrobium sp. CFH 75288]|uniref:lipocalin-like domain-containing protein n=1 Tax=Rubellimicrobium sp. CFH 75288 TaxID=2697034 RepID=UPI00141295AF|nr:lipocalin-like domain-containing protein [Rubellimicrobium sp. CFH 75288]NAZ37603.1 iron ABC transporter permease [Rubellimicrobium sp. CFH 75288]